MNYRIDYLPNHIEYKICQGDGFYHFNTDTGLLGEYFKVEKEESLLDVGTNNAALLVYAHYKGCLHLTGIDINKQALEFAQKTIEENHFKAKLLCQDFSNFQSLEGFDVIVCNPPYFNSVDEKEKNLNENIKIARHEHYLLLRNLCKSFALNLKKTGKIYMVHRPNRLKDIENELKKNGLYINELQFIYNLKKKEPISMLLTVSFSSSFIQLNDRYI